MSDKPDTISFTVKDDGNPLGLPDGAIGVALRDDGTRRYLYPKTEEPRVMNDEKRAIIAAARAWVKARSAACQAPLGDATAWSALGKAESDLSAAVRDAPSINLCDPQPASEPPSEQ